MLLHRRPVSCDLAVDKEGVAVEMVGQKNAEGHMVVIS